MITRENYEEYLMLKADGELDAAGRRALDEFFRMYPELEAERAMWHSLKLTADEQLHFPDKEQLLKPVPQTERRIIPFMWAAAAALILFMILIPMLLKNNEDKEQHLTQTQNQTLTAPAQPTPLKPPPDAPTRQTEPINVAQKPQSPKTTTTNPEPAPEPRKVNPSEQLAPLEMIADRQVPAPEQYTESPIPMQIDLNAAYANTTVEPAHKVGRVNIAPANQDALRLLKDAMEERINQAKNVAKNLRETAFEIRVKKGAININF